MDIESLGLVEALATSCESSSGKRGQFVMHHGCLSELLGPHPPRLTTLFPVLF
jgi:hypothetical protein